MNEPSSFTGRIISNFEIAPGHFLMSVELPPSFRRPEPGQFVMVRPEGGDDLLLGRPFSVYGFHRDAADAGLELLYRVSGKGTERLSRLEPLGLIRVFGPLGKGFEICRDKRNIILIAGGVGIAPITFLASVIEAGKAAGRIIGYIGAQCADRLVGLNRLDSHCSEVRISTDDGSLGCCGLVTETLLSDLQGYDPGDTVIYACGPAAMLKCIADILRDQPIPCQVSVEERMACGIGACLGCAVHVRDDRGEPTYRRVCKEGPVFNINDLLWDDEVD